MSRGWSVLVVAVGVWCSGCWNIEYLVPVTDGGAMSMGGDGGEPGGGGGGEGGGGGGGAVGDGGVGPYNRIFVTAGRYQVGSLGDGDGGVSVADAICNSAAGENGYAGNFIALLATSTRSLSQRVPAGVRGWVTGTGAPVFNELGSPRMAHRLGNAGYPVVGSEPEFVATGATNWGATGTSNCEDWTSLDAGTTFVVGDATEGFDGWANASTMACDQQLPLYCAQIDHGAEVRLSPEPGQLRVFVTEQTYASGRGRAGFDDACAAEAADAGLTGSFAAFVNTQSASADLPAFGRGERFRMDGVRTTDPVEIEAFNPLFTYPIRLTAKGQTLVDSQLSWPVAPEIVRTDTAVWFGATGASCNDWFSITGTAYAVDVTSLRGNHWDQWATSPSSVRDCGMPAHLFCVELP